MLIQTSRFGAVEVDDDRVISFEKGLLGFGSQKDYVLLQPNDEGYFFWLQAVDAPDLAFVVTDPSLFVPDYVVPLRSEQMQEMGLSEINEAQVFVIVNKRGDELTGNLQGPLVINTKTRCGEQLVLSDKRFHTRVTLMELDAKAKASA